MGLSESLDCLGQLNETSFRSLDQEAEQSGHPKAQRPGDPASRDLIDDQPIRWEVLNEENGFYLPGMEQK